MENQKETGVQSALEAKVYQLEHEKLQLEQEKRQLEEEKRQLEQEKRQLEEERNHEKQLRSDREREKKFLRVHIAVLEAEVRNLESEMDPSVAYLKRLEKKLDVAEFNYSKVLKQCIHLKEDYSKVRQESVHLKEENRKLNIAFEELKGQQQDIQQLEERLMELKGQQKETGVQSALEAKVYQFEQEKHQLEQEKHQLEQEKRQLEEERTHDKELRSEIEDENQLLNVCIDGLQDKVRHLESKMDPSVAHLKGLKKRLSIAEFNYSKVLQECQHLKEENRNLKDIKQLEREKAEFQRRAESLEEELKLIKEQNPNQGLQDIEGGNKLLRVCFAGLQDKVRDLQSEMDPSVAYLKGLKEKLEVAEFNYSKVLQECKHLKEENRNLKDIQKLEREKAEFQRRAESLEEELKLIKEQKPNQGLRKLFRNSQYSSNSKSPSLKNDREILKDQQDPYYSSKHQVLNGKTKFS